MTPVTVTFVWGWPASWSRYWGVPIVTTQRPRTLTPLTAARIWRPSMASSDEVWVLRDSRPRDYRVGGDDDLTTATAVTAAMKKDGVTVPVPVDVLDATTVRLTRAGLDLTDGLWKLEVQAVYPDGDQTYPEAKPHTVWVRPQIAGA